MRPSFACLAIVGLAIAGHAAARERLPRHVAHAEARKNAPPAAPPARKDPRGDALPPGALVRLGSLRREIGLVFEETFLFSDTVKARFIDKELSNRYVPRGNRRKVQSQLAIYDYIKSLEQPD